MIIMSIELYVDIDQDFDRFLKSRTWSYIKENWKYVENILRRYWNITEYSGIPLYYRKSSSGNVHLKLEIPDNVEILDQFQIRALLHDDPWRIGIDLRRLAIQGQSEINRIFEMKVKDGKVFRVGEWRDISSEVVK
jgi:hypothetical protein